MRLVSLPDFAGIDAGPTVLTMRWVFDALLAGTGRRLGDYLELGAVELLARHGWMDGSRLDLYANTERSHAAIAEFSGARDADGYLRFCKLSQSIYEALAKTYIEANKPSPIQLALRARARGLPGLFKTLPTRSLWAATGEFFSDRRLRQLFSRYATYCGSSPFRAPSTLMLVAAVEQQGVHIVRGGMHAVAKMLQAVAEELGVHFRLSCAATELRLGSNGGTEGVVLADGTLVPARVAVFNGDVAALARGVLGASVASRFGSSAAQERSLSAITWSMAAQPIGFDLSHHNVFFGDDYQDEFRAVFERRQITAHPTVYICAQDRTPWAEPSGAERMLVLVNAPADGDLNVDHEALISGARQASERVLAAAGLKLQVALESVTGPTQFDGLFPGAGGALYGPANHGWRGSFVRRGARTGIPGFYLCGGSVHPGPGVPMAALSGRLAASRVIRDFG